MKTARLLCLALFVACLTSSAATVTVTPSSPGNWTYFSSDSTVSDSFVTGPGTPPAGIGSLQMNIGADGDQYVKATDTVDFAGTLLADINQLSYSTYQQHYQDGQAIYLSFILDNGDRLYFEPVYQDGSYGGDTVPDQCSGITNCAGLNQWQTWDALAGGWWSNDGFENSNGGPPNFTLADYAADNPGVTITAVRVIAGGGAGAWDNFVGNVDNLTIGTASATVNFDFEPDAVPEPATWGLNLAGFTVAAITLWRRRRHQPTK